MKNLSIILYLGLIATSVSVSARVVEDAPNARRCDLSTLKGHYIFYTQDVGSATAGGVIMNGDGTAVSEVSISLPANKDTPTIQSQGVITYTMDSLVDCHYTLTNAAHPVSTIDLYADASGDKAAFVYNKQTPSAGMFYRDSDIKKDRNHQ